MKINKNMEIEYTELGEIAHFRHLNLRAYKDGDYKSMNINAHRIDLKSVKIETRKAKKYTVKTLRFNDIEGKHYTIRLFDYKGDKNE